MLSPDVKCLYTSIPNAEEIKAVKESFDKHTSKNVTTKVITFLALILTLNNFVFNCKNYLQIKGCVTGTICALSYANIFRDRFEKKYIYSFLQGLALMYLRFIHDLFFIWTGTKEQFKNCLNRLKKNTISSSLNIKYHKLASHFLIQKSLFKILNLLQKSIGKPMTARTSFI